MSAIAADAQKDLDLALPALNSAVKALDSLTKADITEVTLNALDSLTKADVTEVP